MLDNFARSVQILITLSGNVESQLTNITSQVDKISGRTITIKVSIDTGPVNQLAGAATNAASSITNISDKTKATEKNAVGSFGAIKKSIDDVNAGIGNLISSLAGIAIGGSISGLAWLQSAEAKLYNEQIEEAITNNKKLGFTYDDLKKKVEEQVQAGEGTRQDTEKEFYSTIMAAQKYIGKGPKALDAADAIGDFYFAHQELMKGQGITSPEQMIQRAVRSEGEMGSLFGTKFATAMGIAYEDKAMKSAKSRVKFFVEKGTSVEEGGFTNMSEELAKRPWEQASIALDRLKMDIGDSLATPLAKLTSLFAGLVDTIRKIPGGSALIGWSAILLTAVSVLGLLNSVLVPGITLLKQMVLLTNADTVAKTINILASKALIVTDWLGVTSKAARATATATAAASTAALTGAIGMEIVALEVDAVATTAAATATTGLAAAEWAALSPLLLLAIPLIAIAGLLYLVETRTHAFSNALDKLSKTEMSKDLIQWLEDVGYWAGYAVDKLGNVIESDLFSKIENLNSTYTTVKSGNFAGQVLGSVAGIPGTNILTINKIVTPLSIIQKHLELIATIATWSKSFFSDGSLTSGIYNAIMKLPENLSKSISEYIDNLIKDSTTKFEEIKTSIQGMVDSLVLKFNEFIGSIKGILPSWLGGSSGQVTPTFEGFKEFTQTATKGSENYKSFTQTSDEVLKAAYTEAQTGVPQEHPYIDEYEYKRLVEVAYKQYLESGTPSTGFNPLNELGKLSEQAEKVVQDKIITPAYNYLQSGYNYADELSGGRISAFRNTIGFANGGFVKKTGFALVHSGEPIIPADVANSSRLQNILESIAYGGSSSNTYGDINVRINYTSPTSSASNNMIVMDRISFEHMVSDIIAKRLRQLNGY